MSLKNSLFKYGPIVEDLACRLRTLEDHFATNGLEVTSELLDSTWDAIIATSESLVNQNGTVNNPDSYDWSRFVDGLAICISTK